MAELEATVLDQQTQLLSLEQASIPKVASGTTCDETKEKPINTCFKNLKKCGTSAIITWPVEWHPIHMVLPADSHNHANVSTHLKHGNKTFAVQRRRLLADAQNKGIINIRDLEYIGGATINETMYRFNCYDTKDAKTGLCHLLNEECDCEGDKRIINFEYEGEKKRKVNISMQKLQVCCNVWTGSIIHWLTLMSRKRLELLRILQLGDGGVCCKVVRLGVNLL